MKAGRVRLITAAMLAAGQMLRCVPDRVAGSWRLLHLHVR